MATAVPVEEMKRQIMIRNEPVFEAVAQTGIGVFDTLKAIARMVLVELRKTA